MLFSNPDLYNPMMEEGEEVAEQQVEAAATEER